LRLGACSETIGLLHEQVPATTTIAARVNQDNLNAGPSVYDAVDGSSTGT
jgi:hypothetical protein